MFWNDTERQVATVNADRIPLIHQKMGKYSKKKPEKTPKKKKKHKPKIQI